MMILYFSLTMMAIIQERLHCGGILGSTTWLLSTSSFITPAAVYVGSSETSMLEARAQWKRLEASKCFSYRKAVELKVSNLKFLASLGQKETLVPALLLLQQPRAGMYCPADHDHVAQIKLIVCLASSNNLQE